MKEIFISLGLALLFGMGALIATFLFLEGWWGIGTVIVNASVFFVAGYLMGKIKPKSILYSGFVIIIPFWMGFADIHYFNDLFNLLASPSKINGGSFYTLLPMIALVSTFIGLYIGKKEASKVSRSIKNSAA